MVKPFEPGECYHQPLLAFDRPMCSQRRGDPCDCGRRPGRCWTTGIPCDFSSSSGPIPDRIRTFGVFIAPGDSKVSQCPRNWRRRPSISTSTPRARFPSKMRRVTSASVIIIRFGRDGSGRTQELNTDSRLPSRMRNSAIEASPGASIISPLVESKIGTPMPAHPFAAHSHQ